MAMTMKCRRASAVEYTTNVVVADDRVRSIDVAEVYNVH